MHPWISPAIGGQKRQSVRRPPTPRPDPTRKSAVRAYTNTFRPRCALFDKQSRSSRCWSSTASAIRLILLWQLCSRSRQSFPSLPEGRSVGGYRLKLEDPEPSARSLMLPPRPPEPRWWRHSKFGGGGGRHRRWSDSLPAIVGRRRRRARRWGCDIFLKNDLLRAPVRLPENRSRTICSWTGGESYRLIYIPDDDEQTSRMQDREID